MKSESEVQNEIRLHTSTLGGRLYRNNVGVAMRKDGTPVRYGLCNESYQVNSKLKSSDLIGIRPVVITQEMVGQTIGQFVSIEVKREGWKYKGSDREVAQKRWLDLVKRLGGIGGFISDTSQLDELFKS